MDFSQQTDLQTGAEMTRDAREGWVSHGHLSLTTGRNVGVLGKGYAS
jgi:hypothetical protein